MLGLVLVFLMLLLLPKKLLKLLVFVPHFLLMPKVLVLLLMPEMLLAKVLLWV